ncbi:MAG TPA: ATP-binding protein [Bryobacteraceae bacterium]|nr:ATP-binding protein [Bryobacteraceae bacterium]
MRPQDAVWVLLFAALALFGPIRTPPVFALLSALGILQVVEPRIPWFQSRAGGGGSVGLKLALCYLLILATHGIASSYFWILFFPVISAATVLGMAGTAISTLLAGGLYLSFLFRLNEGQFIPTDEIPELLLRVLFLPVVGFLTYQLAQASREQALKYQATAEQLADANRSLQEAEAAVRRSERLAALGQLSAGLAHELRNPLGTIKASSEMLLKSVEKENAIAREMAGFISSEVDRSNSLVSRFLDFARPLEIRRELTDLTQVLDRSIEQIERRQPPFDVTIYKNYSPEIRPIPLDAELMERVFSNLLTNAAQASPPRSAITVKTRQIGDLVEIAVIDRGAGIDPANREAIFNPFFTTKRDGVGLGLAIVSKIVDGHGGSIDVESEPGNGSVFRVILPVTGEQT